MKFDLGGAIFGATNFINQKFEEKRLAKMQQAERFGALQKTALTLGKDLPADKMGPYVAGILGAESTEDLQEGFKLLGAYNTVATDDDYYNFGGNARFATFNTREGDGVERYLGLASDMDMFLNGPQYENWRSTATPEQVQAFNARLFDTHQQLYGYFDERNADGSKKFPDRSPSTLYPGSDKYLSSLGQVQDPDNNPFAYNPETNRPEPVNDAGKTPSDETAEDFMALGAGTQLSNYFAQRPTSISVALKNHGATPNQVSELKKDPEEATKFIINRVAQRSGTAPYIQDFAEEFMKLPIAGQILAKGSLDRGNNANVQMFQNFANNLLLNPNLNAVSITKGLAAFMPLEQDIDIPRPNRTGVRTFSPVPMEDKYINAFTNTIGDPKEFSERLENSRRNFQTVQDLYNAREEMEQSNLEVLVTKGIDNAQSFLDVIQNDENLSNSAREYLNSKLGALSDSGAYGNSKQDYLLALSDIKAYELAYYRAKALEGTSARLSERDFEKSLQIIKGSLFESKGRTMERLGILRDEAKFQYGLFQNVSEDLRRIPQLSYYRDSDTNATINQSLRNLKASGLVLDSLRARDVGFRSVVLDPDQAYNQRPDVKLKSDIKLPNMAPDSRIQIAQAIDENGQPVLSQRDPKLLDGVFQVEYTDVNGENRKLAIGSQSLEIVQVEQPTEPVLTQTPTPAEASQQDDEEPAEGTTVLPPGSKKKPVINPQPIEEQPQEDPELPAIEPATIPDAQPASSPAPQPIGKPVSENVVPTTPVSSSPVRDVPMDRQGVMDIIFADEANRRRREREQIRTEQDAERARELARMRGKPTDTDEVARQQAEARRLASAEFDATGMEGDEGPDGFAPRPVPRPGGSTPYPVPRPEGFVPEPDSEPGQPVIIALGTNDFSNPQSAADNVRALIERVRESGKEPIIVPPNINSPKFMDVANVVIGVANDLGATVEQASYSDSDPLHITMNEAKRIRDKYEGASVYGDSNAVRILGQESDTAFVGAQSKAIFDKFNLTPLDEPSEQPSKNSVTPLLDFIGKVESGGSYNASNRGTANDKIVGSTLNTERDGKPLTDLTIREIIELQSIKSPRNADRLFAVGKYQIIPDTMKELVEKMDIDVDQKFTPEIQDRMGTELITGGWKRKELADYVTGKSDDENAAMLDLAKEFASMPNPETGLSHYGSGNKALYTVEETRDILRYIRENYKVLD